MSLVVEILKAQREGTFPHVYCPLCRQKNVKLKVTHFGEPQVVLEVHDVPSDECVFGARESPGGRDTFIRVRCPASSQPVSEVP